MLGRKSNYLLAGIVVGTLWFTVIHFIFDTPLTIETSTPSATNDNDPNWGVGSRENYLKDDEFITKNTFKGDVRVKSELAVKLNKYKNIQSFQALDYSDASTKGDIIPDYKQPISIKFITSNDKSLMSGEYSNLRVYTQFDHEGRTVLKSFTGTKLGELYLDAKYLSTFLKNKAKYDFFLADLKKHELTLDSFISAEIVHGKRAFDGVDPNYFSSAAYIQKMRVELDTLNFETITKIDEYTYEFSNSNNSILPLSLGDQLYYYKSRLIFTSEKSFILERYANEVLYMKVNFNEDYPMPILTGKSAKLDDLAYDDEYKPGVNPVVNNVTK